MNILDDIAALIPTNGAEEVSAADLRASFAKAFLYNFKYQRGWDRLGNPDSMGTITHDNVAKTFAIAPKSGQATFDFWCDGSLYQKPTSMSISLDVSATGAYYIMFDSTGSLEVKAYDSIIITDFMKCITGLYYYNKEDDVLWWAHDEQHGVVLDPMAHFNMHFTRHFQWAMGCEPNGFIDSSQTFTSIGSGVLLDEDIPMTPALAATLPFGYKLGTTGRWVITPPDNKVGHIATGDTYVSYNKNTAGVWSLEESTSSTDYIIYIIMATNFVALPYLKVVGRQFYGSRSAARDALYEHIHAVNLSGTPGAEAKHLFAYICRRNGDLEDGGSPLYETTIDLRGMKLT